MGDNPDAPPALWEPRPLKVTETAKCSIKHRSIIYDQAVNIFERLQYLLSRAVQHASTLAIAAATALPPPLPNEESELQNLTDDDLNDLKKYFGRGQIDYTFEHDLPKVTKSQLHDIKVYLAIVQIADWRGEQAATLEDSWLTIINDCPDQIDPFDHLDALAPGEEEEISDDTLSGCEDKGNFDEDFDYTELPAPTPSPSGYEDVDDAEEKRESLEALSLPWSQSFAGQLENYINELDEEELFGVPNSRNNITTTTTTEEQTPPKREVDAEQLLRLLREMKYVRQACTTLLEVITEVNDVRHKRGRHCKMQQLKGDITPSMRSQGYGSPLVQMVSAEEKFPSHLDAWDMASWSSQRSRHKIAGKDALSRPGASSDRSGIVPIRKFIFEDDRFW